MDAHERKKPGATNTGQVKNDYGLVYRLQRTLQAPFCAACWWLEQRCSQIETAHELTKWNRREN